MKKTYLVVGCPDCRALWIITNEPATTTCPNCRKQHTVSNLRPLARTHEETHARTIRGKLLADRSDQTDSFSSATSYAANEPDLSPPDPRETADLESLGIDPTEFEQPTTRPASLPNPDLIKHAINHLETPTPSNITQYAEQHDIPPSTTESLLEKLEYAGEITQAPTGEYRIP